MECGARAGTVTQRGAVADGAVARRWTRARYAADTECPRVGQADARGADGHADGSYAGARTRTVRTRGSTRAYARAPPRTPRARRARWNSVSDRTGRWCSGTRASRVYAYVYAVTVRDRIRGTRHAYAYRARHAGAHTRNDSRYRVSAGHTDTPRNATRIQRTAQTGVSAGTDGRIGSTRIRAIYARHARAGRYRAERGTVRRHAYRHHAHTSHGWIPRGAVRTHIPFTLRGADNGHASTIPDRARSTDAPRARAPRHAARHTADHARHADAHTRSRGRTRLPDGCGRSPDDNADLPSRTRYAVYARSPDTDAPPYARDTRSPARYAIPRGRRQLAYHASRGQDTDAPYRHTTPPRWTPRAGNGYSTRRAPFRARADIQHAHTAQITSRHARRARARRKYTRAQISPAKYSTKRSRHTAK